MPKDILRWQKHNSLITVNSYEGNKVLIDFQPNSYITYYLIRRDQENKMLNDFQAVTLMNGISHFD